MTNIDGEILGAMFLVFLCGHLQLSPGLLLWKNFISVIKNFCNAQNMNAIAPNFTNNDHPSNR